MWRTVAVLVLLYLFLVSINLLGKGLKMFGTGFADQLMATTSNPVVGLFVGILVTSVIQSSSATTSIIVSLVMGGTLSVQNAVPIVMGANIGTTVTSLLVSFACVSRREEFRRALGGATVDEFFKAILVALFLPVELLTGFLRHTSTWLAGLMAGAEICTFRSPVKSAVEPLVKMIASFIERSLGPATGATILVVVSLALLLGALFLMVRVLKAASVGRLGVLFDRFIGSGGIRGIVLGLVVTMTVQSSSVTLSLCVPMAAAGIVTVEQVFAVALGANVGTTVTALLAAFSTGNVNALAIALVHTVFNVTGVLLFYPIKPLRRIPIGLARWFAGVGSRSRWIAVLYLVGAFFVLPLICIFVGRLL